MIREKNDTLKLTVMILYEIDYFFDGKWEHTSGESTFPFEEDYNKGDYTQEDIDKHAYTFVEKKLQMEHRHGEIDSNKIHAKITKI